MEIPVYSGAPVFGVIKAVCGSSRVGSPLWFFRNKLFLLVLFFVLFLSHVATETPPYAAFPILCLNAGAQITPGGQVQRLHEKCKSYG